jgi:ATP-dependent Clp protease ATP-binding subunit ClpC
MEAKFSSRVKNVLNYSREEAIRLGNDYIGVEHFLLGIIRDGEGKAIDILSKYNVDFRVLREKIETAIQSDDNVKEDADINLIKQAEKCLKRTYLEAKIFKNQLIGTEHLLLAILRDQDNIATQSIEQ